jgi:hypothetical protein
MENKETQKVLPHKRTFKEYRKDSNSDSMETSFGEHSLKHKPDSMETSFGEHSKKKVNEDKDYPERITDEQNKHMHEVVAPIKKLRGDHLEAVKEYSDESLPLNSVLHRHDKRYDISTKNNEQYRKTISDLDSALDKHKTTQDSTVYTGIKYSPAKHFRRENGVVPDKKVVHLPAFTSTSSSFHSAREFSDNTMHPNDERHGIDYDGDYHARHVLKIDVPKGTHAMSLQSHSFVPAEKEILLHRGHNIEIDKMPEHVGNNTYLWHARVVSRTPADLSKPK